MVKEQESPIPNRLAAPIFIFEDYVDYLSAWYGYAKRFRLTQKTFMERTGAGPQAYFSDILARRKKLSLRHIVGFTDALDLSGDSAEFFSLLVQKEHANIGVEKEIALKKLSLLREKHLHSLVTDSNAEYFSSWKYPVVREFIVSKGHVRSFKEIKNAFLHISLTLDEVRHVVKKLIQWKMIEIDKELGGYAAGPGSGTISYESMPHSVVNDVKRIFIESSVHAMETLPKNERHITMAVRGISKAHYERFCLKIDELRKEFLSDDSNSGDVEYVYGFNVQLFPLMSTKSDTIDDTQDANNSSFPDTTESKR